MIDPPFPPFAFSVIAFPACFNPRNATARNQPYTDHKRGKNKRGLTTLQVDAHDFIPYGLIHIDQWHLIILAYSRAKNYHLGCPPPPVSRPLHHQGIHPFLTYIPTDQLDTVFIALQRALESGFERGEGNVDEREAGAAGLEEGKRRGEAEARRGAGDQAGFGVDAECGRGRVGGHVGVVVFGGWGWTGP